MSDKEKTNKKSKKIEEKIQVETKKITAVQYAVINNIGDYRLHNSLIKKYNQELNTIRHWEKVFKHEKIV